jgi:hypothetical protein
MKQRAEGKTGEDGGYGHCVTFQKAGVGVPGGLLEKILRLIARFQRR